jgi:hypothetical protein
MPSRLAARPPADSRILEPSPGFRPLRASGASGAPGFPGPAGFRGSRLPGISGVPGLPGVRGFRGFARRSGVPRLPGGSGSRDSRDLGGSGSFVRSALRADSVHELARGTRGRPPGGLPVPADGRRSPGFSRLRDPGFSRFRDLEGFRRFRDLDGRRRGCETDRNLCWRRRLRGPSGRNLSGFPEDELDRAVEGSGDPLIERDSLASSDCSPGGVLAVIRANRDL